MKKFRSAIIGCGNIFPTHAVGITLSPDAELIAVCDKIEERAKAKAEQYHCPYYTDYKEMIEKEKPDTVHLCLPHYLHSVVAVYAMEHGVDVVTEKPLAINMEEADKMMACKEKTGRRLACIFQNRYNVGTQLTKQLLNDGTLGRIYGIKCSLTWLRPQEYYSSSDWKGTLDKEGGGVIIDQAIHTLDAIKYIVNEKVVSVDASISHRSKIINEVEDTAEGMVCFESGLVANFHAINYYSFDDDVTIDLDCENGRVHIVSDKAEIALYDGRKYYVERNPRENVDYGDIKAYWGVNHSKQIADIYDSFRTGKEMFVTLESAYETLRMVCAIYESGYSGKRVEIK